MSEVRSNIDSEVIALPVVGTRRKEWQLVNHMGGLLKYFIGTKRQAEKEAARLQKERARG